MCHKHAGLKTIREFLKSVPDGKLLEGLRPMARQRAQRLSDRRPVGTLLLTIVLRHPSIDACLADLRSNEALRRLIGIDAPGEAGEKKVPKPYNISRFLEVLGRPQHLDRLRASFDAMVRRLGDVVPDLGRHTAGDASALNVRRPRDASLEAETDEHGLPLLSDGRKEYQDDNGQVTKVVEWFGYKFHLLVDVKHEVVLAYQVTSPKTADADMIPDLVEEAQANLPEGRIETLAYDKVADQEKMHEFLFEKDIRTVIENRSLWRNQTEQMLPGHDGRSNIVHDEAGTLYCYNQVSDPPVRHRMSYIGHEAARGTLKYR